MFPEHSPWPVGDGEMAGRICAFDWTATSLGPLASWSQSLRNAVELMLASSFPSSLVCGPDAILLYNDDYRPLIGPRHPAALGASALASFPEVRSHFAAVLERVWRGETVRLDDQRYTSVHEGAPEEAWFTVSLSPVRDETGSIIAALAVMIETTERVRAEQERERFEAELRHREERFRTLVQNIADYAIYMLDPQGVITEWTDGAKRVKGYASEEVIGRSPSIFYTPDAAAASVPQQELAEAAARGRSESEGWRLRKGGARFWANEIITAIRDEAGALVGFSVICRDLTERRRADEAVRASEERFRTLIQRSADAIQLVTPDGTLLYSSDSVEVVLGYRPEEIAGANIAPYVHPDDLPAVVAWISEVSETPDATATRQYRVRHRDGSWVWIEATITNQLDNPIINAIVGNFRNITERKRAEAEREAFVAAAAHDLRTPLAAMKAQAQLLRRRLRRTEGPDPAALESGLLGIEAAAGRMAALIEEMMDAAHLRGERQLELSVEPTDLVALAEAAAEESRRSTTRHAVRVVVEPSSLVGAWDGARLGRVLGNLLGNAVKYSPDGGEIVVRVGREEDGAGAWAVVRVSDPGIGIPAADLPHLFEWFRRGANVGGIGGTGIGLAGAKQIIAQHGGTIDVASEEGTGTTFTVRLPLVEADTT